MYMFVGFFLSFSARVKSGLTRKDELYNQLVDDFRNRKVDFPKSVAQIDGSYFIQVY